MVKIDVRRAGLCILAAIAMLCWSCSEKSPNAEQKDKAGPGTTLPAGAIPLSSALQTVEGSGYTPVVEVELEKDHWKIKAYKAGQLVQLKVDLMKGEILPDPAPAFARPLSAVVKSIEDQGFSPITDIEPAGGGAGWDVEAYKGNSEHKLRVDASGQITTK